jgi:tRNA threonylcarbamoyladenosine biosynthesis protein TsaE
VEVFETDGPEATEALGAQLAARLVAGDVVYVVGELGAGKTTLVRGACRALGVGGPVTSPTFAIAHRYRAASGTTVSHLDLYRLASLAAEDPDLLADYVGADAITFVEWPPEQPGALGALPRITISLSHAGEQRRHVEVNGE